MARRHILGIWLLAGTCVTCGTPQPHGREASNGAVPTGPRRIEGMWSDPPATVIGQACFFSCPDAFVARLNELLDAPANDSRPFPQLRAEADKYWRDTYVRPLLIGAALKSYPQDPADDPGLLECRPWGLARQMFVPHQLEIRSLGNERVELHYGEWDARRIVHMDGRSRSASEPPSRLGHAVGRWEGETLVVETTGVASDLTSWRFIHSDQLQTVERFTRSDDGETLQLVATLTDPASFSQPIVTKKIWKWAPNSEIAPYDACERPIGVKRGASPR